MYSFKIKSHHLSTPYPESRGAVYDQERIDLSQTIVDAVKYRRGADDDFDVAITGQGVNFRGERLTLSDWNRREQNGVATENKNSPQGQQQGQASVGRTGSYHVNNSKMRRQLNF